MSVIYLSSFIDVLLPVNNFDGPVLQPGANIARVQPAVFIDSLSSLARIVVIA